MSATGPKFTEGDKVVYSSHMILYKMGKRIPSSTVKYGEIKSLRNDSHERKYNHPHGKYFYIVEYENGTSETYESESELESFYSFDMSKLS